MKNCLEKVRQSGNDNVMLCERGTSFGYNTLVVDMTGLRVMKDFGVPVIFDATHSVQKPGGNGTSTGGNREYVEYLAKAAVAAKAIPNCNVCFVSGADMQAPLTEFLTALSTVAPQSIGGKVPGDDFYCILK